MQSVLDSNLVAISFGGNGDHIQVSYVHLNEQNQRVTSSVARWQPDSDEFHKVVSNVARRLRYQGGEWAVYLCLPSRSTLFIPFSFECMSSEMCSIHRESGCKMGIPWRQILLHWQL